MRRKLAGVVEVVVWVAVGVAAPVTVVESWAAVVSMFVNAELLGYFGGLDALGRRAPHPQRIRRADETEGTIRAH